MEKEIPEFKQIIVLKKVFCLALDSDACTPKGGGGLL